MKNLAYQLGRFIGLILKSILITIAVFFVLCLLIGIFATTFNTQKPENKSLNNKASNNFTVVFQKSHLDAHQENIYVRGIKNLQLHHTKISNFTVGQVISIEENKENNEALYRKTKSEQIAKDNLIKAQKAQELENQRMDNISVENLGSAVELANETLGARMYTAYAISSEDCKLTINADFYENATEQDKEIIRRTVSKMCIGSYQLVGGHQRKLPQNGLNIDLVDLNGTSLYHDFAMND